LPRGDGHAGCADRSNLSLEAQPNWLNPAVEIVGITLDAGTAPSPGTTRNHGMMALERGTYAGEQ
jgi:hypothetical protein